MAIGHMNIKRIIYRSLEEIDATMKIAKVTSVGDAINTFRAKVDIQVMNRNGYKEPPNVKKRLMKKHEVMLQYFEKMFADFFEEYDYEQVLPDVEPELRGRVWVCWWQGIDNAPEIVKRCVESIQKNVHNRKVTIITEDNYKNYVKFPDWIEEKKKKGIISRTHYSDLLRLELLAKYGGVWLDSTFFCVKPDIEEYFSKPIWSIKRPNYLHCSVACGYFANYSLGCTYENRNIYAVIRDFLIKYWEKNDTIIDYLLTDYLIVLAQRHNDKIAKVFENITPNNPCCDELYKILGEPYDEDVWQELKKDTALFKLTWKQEFSLKKNGCDTFYAKLLDGKL